MKIYNTMSKRKEEFVPLEEGKVKMYVCGPTVYNYIHIGNARPMIVFDTVRRYFEYKNYDVNYVSNFTDVDDKIIKKANEEGVTAEEISQRYIAECKKDMDGMNIEPATKNPLATEEIDGMISMIETLIEKGYAYEKNGTVYYRTRKFKDYGKLSHKNLDDLQSGGRALLVSGEDEKEDSLDFVLWKPKKEGEPAWVSPWGEGRPGWHIECSEMSKKYLGEQIDIHAGGEDLVFPHHENEIAQSEAANGKEFAKYWMHNAFLNIDNRKMSKSLGNCIYLSDTPEEVKKKVMSMYTDPNHIQVSDPGQVEGNTVFTYLDAFSSDEDFAEFLPDYKNLDELKDHYRRGGLGDVKVKKFLLNVINKELEPIRARRHEYEKDIPEVYNILKKGTEAAYAVAQDTLDDVKAAMKIDYFNDAELIKVQSEKYSRTE